MTTFAPLHDYQVFAKDYILKHPKCALYLPVGAGKSLITLEAIYELQPQSHVLIIAPKNVAKTTWYDEIQKWEFPFRTKSFILNENGKPLSAKKRKELYDQSLTEPPTVYFINRDLIADLIIYMSKKPQFIWPFQTVVIDESQSFKSYKAVRFKKMQQVLPAIHRLIELTGSPKPRDLQDLWSQIYMLDNGRRLGKNITAYRNTFFMPGRSMNGYPIEWIPLANAEDEIHRRISDIVMSLPNMVQLPPLIKQNVMIRMTSDEMAKYKHFMKNNVLALDDEHVIEAKNAGVLQNKLSQMASGTLYYETGSHEYEIIHQHKLEMCEYIINNTDSPVMIAYWYKSELDQIIKYLTEQEIDVTVFDGSPEMTRRWNNRELPVILLHPASSGRGLNLQQGGNTLIWYTIPWSLEDYQQTIGRIYRQGQTETVMIYHLLTQMTIDEKILQVQERKELNQQILLDAVRATVAFAEG